MSCSRNLVEASRKAVVDQTACCVQEHKMSVSEMNSKYVLHVNNTERTWTVCTLYKTLFIIQRTNKHLDTLSVLVSLCDYCKVMMSSAEKKKQKTTIKMNHLKRSVRIQL